MHIIHLVNIKEHAKALYYKHIGLCPKAYDYMWEQCTRDYQEAWILIARTDLIDPTDEVQP